ncbi:hypothetical protein [Streptomyces sp. NPDC018045]|uniref:hypothetical protein n=1 Tax=Streptomyces sp. NPDC018045 TaxID=3365037 RepID=UPI003791DF12
MSALDALAEAYADDPATVEHLLLALADASAHAAHMRHDPAATDYGRNSAYAALDAARERLATVLDLSSTTNGATL